MTVIDGRVGKREREERERGRKERQGQEGESEGRSERAIACEREGEQVRERQKNVMILTHLITEQANGLTQGSKELGTVPWAQSHPQENQTYLVHVLVQQNKH